MREIVNAVFYQNRTGCQWRYLPHDLPSWSAVFYYFGLWRQDGLDQWIQELPRCQVRERDRRSEDPSLVIIDTQSVRAAAGVATTTTGLDANKKVSGRKRGLAVDVMGLITGVVVLAASAPDNAAGAARLDRVSERCGMRLETALVDQGFKDEVVIQAAELRARIEELAAGHRRPGGSQECFRGRQQHAGRCRDVLDRQRGVLVVRAVRVVPEGHDHDLHAARRQGHRHRFGPAQDQPEHVAERHELDVDRTGDGHHGVLDQQRAEPQHRVRRQLYGALPDGRGQALGGRPYADARDVGAGYGPVLGLARRRGCRLPGERLPHVRHAGQHHPPAAERQLDQSAQGPLRQRRPRAGQGLARMRLRRRPARPVLLPDGLRCGGRDLRLRTELPAQHAQAVHATEGRQRAEPQAHLRRAEHGAVRPAGPGRVPGGQLRRVPLRRDVPGRHERRAVRRDRPPTHQRQLDVP
ncbi:transposase [Kitasatospora purpeofusca]